MSELSMQYEKLQNLNEIPVKGSDNKNIKRRLEQHFNDQVRLHCKSKRQSEIVYARTNIEDDERS